MWRFALLLSILFLPANAYAWQQTLTCLPDDPPAPTDTPYCVGDERPKGFSWGGPEVHYVVNERGSRQFPTSDGSIDPALLETIQASFQTWNEPECSNFTFVYDGLVPDHAFNRDDGLNLVVFQDDTWPYGSLELAVTTVTANADGLIVNADMELNGAEQDFAIVTDESSTHWDVQNTITHEAGHILGLDHSDVVGSTMEFEARRGETKKRDLAPDDIEGLCTLYPLPDVMEPIEPQTPDDGCCRVVGRKSSGSWVLLALLALGLAQTRRREKHQRPPR